MEDPLYIDDEPLRHGLDYYYLKSEGIKFIQQLSGALWTDFNEHDPGVTILEQLCFALTDLSYRTDFDVQDYFYDKNKNTTTFYKQEELFPCNAISINDYRKIILDSVSGLNNIWFFSLSEKRSSINGLYKIILDVNEKINSAEEKNEIIKKTKEIYFEHRNFCEDLEEVEIASSISISFHAVLEIDEKKDAESIMARIYFDLTNYLSPEIHFYSREELLIINYGADTLFEGPLMKHGFIKEKDLCAKPSRILISDLIKIIMGIEGVVGVRNSYLKVGDELYKNQIEIGEGELLRLICSFGDATSNGIQFYRDSLNSLVVNNNLVKHKLNALIASSKKLSNVNNEISITPQGEYMGLEEYISIQNDFPLIYGIGEYGISPNSNTARKGQVKQLKGYLLLFEQIMANYLSQLANIKDLFSLNQKVRQTYFYQSLENIVPSIKPLLKNKEYQTNLSILSKKQNNDIDRRNRFLDYLLAIHGEVYNQYLLISFNYYYDKPEYEIFLIDNKIKFLQSILSIAKNRARAFNYKKYKSVNTIVGLEERIYLLLGISCKNTDKITNYKSHPLLNIYDQYGLKLVSTYIGNLYPSAWEMNIEKDTNLLDRLFVKKNYCFVDTEDVLVDEYSEVEKNKLLRQTIIFSSGVISEIFLREGLNLEQYNVGEEEGLWTIIFKPLEQGNWIKISVYNSEKEANASVQLLIIFLKKLNIETERFHCLEHILLRPDRKDSRYGIFLLSPEGKPLLRSIRLYTFLEREKVIEELSLSTSYYENYIVEITKEGDFEIIFTTFDCEHSFVSITAKESVEEVHKDMESLFQYMSNRFQVVSYTNKIGLYIRYSEDTAIIPENFFSFRSSILFPNWTPRFNNSEFRSVAEDAIIENSLAHISLQVVWLGFDDIVAYEKIYYAWLEEKNNDIQDKERLNKLSNSIVIFLLQYNDYNCSYA